MRVLQFLLVAFALALSGVAAGCAESAAPMPADAVVIDVRTPSEFASGHLEGALNIDVEAADFSVKIGELDKDGSYVVYCRSGNRSATATSTMTGLGFIKVTDAGGIDDAAASTGLDIVSS